MPFPLLHRISGTIVTIVMIASCLEVEAEEIVTVRLQSGRRFTAAVDGRTDQERLWLRFQGDATTIRRPIDWDRITGVRHNGRELAPGEFRSLAHTLVASPEQSDGWSLPKPSSSPPPPDGRLERFPSASPEAPIARFLEIEARVANWDEDVAVDGIELHIYPISGADQPMGIRGTLDVEAIGLRPVALGTPTRSRSRQAGKPFLTLGHWTRAVHLSDFGPQGAVYRLEFQAENPEFDYDLGSYGLVNARLAIPGEGVLNASAAMVRLRPFSTVRDRSERFRGERFFPTERTGPR